AARHGNESHAGAGKPGQQGGNIGDAVDFMDEQPFDAVAGGAKFPQSFLVAAPARLDDQADRTRDASHSVSVSQERIGSPRARIAKACSSRTRWNAREKTVHTATPIRPSAGKPRMVATIRMARLGFRRAVTVRNQ